MRCANPQCSAELVYLRDGSLQLLQYEPDSQQATEYEDGAFPMRPFPSRFFWLCAECSRVYVMKAWTSLGVVLSLRHPVPVMRSDPRPLNQKRPQAA